LFRRNSKAYTFVIIKVGVIHAYLGYNTATIQKLMGFVSLIKKMSGRVHTALIKQLCAQEVMMSTIPMKKFLTVLMDELK
jgi:hypothetical protein